MNIPRDPRSVLLPLTLAVWLLPFSTAEAVPVDRHLAVEDAAVDWRWIGLRSDADGECPRPEEGRASWIVSRLFDDEEAGSDASSIPATLRRFCSYEHPWPKKRDLETIKALVKARKLSRVEPDYMAVASSGVLAEETWQPLRDQFRAQVGRVGLPLTGATPVRLAVLDTQPTAVADTAAYAGGPSLHGYSLVNMAYDLLCDDDHRDRCLAQVTTRLALPYVYYAKARRIGKSLDRGGFLGLIGEQARTIRREVRAWKKAGASNAKGGQRLVLNLSFAWDGRFGGLEPDVSQMPLPVRAVYRALQESSCLGVLVVAAAGNRGGGPEPESGPLLPAAWEQHAAPDAAECQRMFGISPAGGRLSGGRAGAYRPLLHAAGGVRADGSPLFNARPRGLPRLAGFADHAVVQSRAGQPTATVTGTSVSALVVSAAAAAVWYYRPELPAHEVMETLYEAGEDLGTSSEFCLGGTSARPCSRKGLRSRRVSLCRSVVAACGEGDGACPPAARTRSCPQQAITLNHLAGLDLETFDRTALQLDLSSVDVRYPPVAECGGETVWYRRGHRPRNPCPHRQFFSSAVEAWTKPQPESNPCPNCIIRYASPGILRIEIAGFKATLRDATLKLGATSYALGLPSLREGDRVKVINVPDHAGEPVVLSFTLDGQDKSVLSPVLVLRAPTRQ